MDDEERIEPEQAPADGRDFSLQEMEELLYASWDGNRKIASPFVEGDYVIVAERPRVTGREGRLLWEYRTMGNSKEDIDRMGALLRRIFPRWQLTGLDGRPIGGPAEPQAGEAWAFEELSTRVASWLIHRAIRVVISNPLA